MRLNDWIIGAALLVFAAALAAYARTFPDIPGQQYGAAVFPTLIAIGMAGCGIILIVSGIRQHAPAVAWADWARERHGVRNVVVTVLLVVYYILASHTLGFILTMAPILLLLLRMFGVGWVTSIVSAIVVTIAIQYIFGEFLYVPLPWGVLAPVRW